MLVTSAEDITNIPISIIDKIFNLLRCTLCLVPDLLIWLLSDNNYIKNNCHFTIKNLVVTDGYF